LSESWELIEFQKKPRNKEWKGEREKFGSGNPNLLKEEGM
jgi:hypothetical protein